MTAVKRTDIVVVGGGAAGYISAIIAARNGAGVTIADKAKRPLMKLRISGKGRCNLTNNCTDREFFDNIFRGDKFLRSAVSRFGPSEIMELFEELGVPLKTERGRRVFPVSDKAADVAEALIGEAERCGVRTVRGEVVRILTDGGKVTGVQTDGGVIDCSAAILATGGRSYPGTGSTGDGYRIARELGHTVTKTYPALVSLRCSEDWCSEAEGLSLRNVTLTCREGKKTLFSEMGEMLFTRDGISGPLVLTLSSVIAGKDYSVLKTTIDLKPSLDRATLDKRVLRDMSAMLGEKLADMGAFVGAMTPDQLGAYIGRIFSA